MEKNDFIFGQQLYQIDLLDSGQWFFVMYDLFSNLSNTMNTYFLLLFHLVVSIHLICLSIQIISETFDIRLS